MSELIFVEQKPMEGKEHIPQPGTTIGREGCDINIADPEVSRNHATIRSNGGQVAIEDLGSTNGTFVNGERISGTRALSEGDEVRLGNTVWILQAPAQKTAIADAPAAAAPPQVTAAREIPSEPPAQQQEAPKPPSPPPPVPSGAGAGAAAPPPPPPAAAAGRRGDVDAPDIQPSAIRRVVPSPGGPSAFLPSPPRRRRGSAATRVGATLFAGIVVALTTAAVIAYYVAEPFADGGDAGEPTAAIQSYASAIADGDGNEACDYLTSDARQQVERDAGGIAGNECGEILDFVSNVLNSKQKDDLRNVEPQDVKVDGDSATATIPAITGSSDGDENVELVREDGDWKISDPGN